MSLEMSRETRRLKLHEILSSIPGIEKAYFQPPASISMEYPCIVYNYDDDMKYHANNQAYLIRDRYSVTLITKQAMPDETLSALDAIDYCDFDRHYVSDNLHHFAYRLILTERIQNV